MKKVVLIEQIDFLAYRIEKIFDQYDDIALELFQAPLRYKNSIKHLLTNTDILIVDFDDYRNNLDEVLELLNKYRPAERLQVIAISSNATKEFIRKMAINHIESVIAKPFENVQILEKVLGFLQAPQYARKEHMTDIQPKNISILEWDDYFSIGIAEIDEEHRQLIEKFAQLYHLMKEGQGHAYYFELLDFLKYYVTHHFEHEEKHQYELKFPLLEEHKKRHKEFKEQVECIIGSNNQTIASTAELLYINQFLKNWLTHHILVEDKKIGAFANNNR